MLLCSLALLVSTVTTARAVTVYGQIPLAQTVSADPTNTAVVAVKTLPAHSKAELVPPPIPDPPPPAAYTLNFQRDAAAVNGQLSVPHVGGGFWGFSIEMSVIGQVLGKNSSYLPPTWLNLMANLEERAGSVVVRLGGNTQEYAKLVDSLDDGNTFLKDMKDLQGTTLTPSVRYTKDLFYMAANVSKLVNVKFFMGIPFDDPVNWRLEIAENAQQILGDNLLGLQAGNEPDFYQFFHRRTVYSPQLYTQELHDLIVKIDANPLIPNKNMLLGPSVGSSIPGVTWTPEQVWETGWLDTFKDRLYAITVEHYPDNNCVAAYGGDGNTPAIVPQEVLPRYTSHRAAVDLVAPYQNSGRLAAAAGKPFIMFETNTASCGGFPGISDSFAAALWGVDYGMQMAWANFTHGMLHVGGQNVVYNPFTAPPTNQSSFNRWTVGPIYYSTIVLAEAFGKTNTSRIVDLGGNEGNVFTPSYAIYERDVLNKVALFNFVSDASGASTSQVSITIPGGMPATVSVKYLLADTIVDKSNITWAGQTLGNQLDSDGRFRGNLNVTTITCNAGTCVVPVPAPGFALVFLDNASDQIKIGQATQTFSTTARTKVHNTATVDLGVLATSNGHSGMNRNVGFGSTSAGSVSAAHGRRMIPFESLMSVGAALLASAWVMRVFFC